MNKFYKYFFLGLLLSTLFLVSCKSDNKKPDNPNEGKEIIHTYKVTIPSAVTVTAGATGISDIFLNGKNWKSMIVSEEFTFEPGTTTITFKTESALSSALVFSHLNFLEGEDITITYIWEERINGKVTKTDNHTLTLKEDKATVATKQYNTF